MKNLIIALLIIGSTLSGKAQDTIFFAPEGFPVFTWMDAETYSVFTKVDTADLTLETAYYLDRSLKRQCTYADYGKNIKHGKCIEYYEGGKTWYQSEYKEGIKNGNIISFHPNGKMKRQDFYRNDTLISGWNYNEDGKRVKPYPFEVPPGPQKGQDAFLAEIGKLLKLTEEENEDVVTVDVEFWITRDGDIRATEAKSENAEAAKMVEKAFSNLYSWKSGLRDGEPAVFREFMTIYLDPEVASGRK
ncbi:hypothetical protein O3Q51_13495 [Cryomorphaceae bacterium 1068]|nr:hypothetical protein [Cryomorphaceae bacterium 1068]